MKISKITLHNFRIYKGNNQVDFNTSSENNISIIAGKNGFGKTTFLTALVWCFYGKMIGEVEDKYRIDIKNAGGYDNLLLSIFNKKALDELKNKNITDDKFYVEIKLTDLIIPSIPCKSITIRRSFEYNKKKESVILLIDGDENELTKQVGYDIFINDFILPREIAKFFFFDAEKIVSLAEARSKAELRNLSRAYSEVLGIKKYEDLKKNLESLLSSLRRRGVSKNEKSKLDFLINELQEIQDVIDFNQDKQDETNKKLIELNAKNDGLQEKLIREGNQISLEELQELKERRNWLEKKLSHSKAELKKMMDVVPLAIAGKSLAKLNKQLLLERKIKSSSIPQQLLQNELNQFSERFLNKITKLEFNREQLKKIESQLEEALREESKDSPQLKAKQIYLDFSEEKFRQFQSLFQYINSSFKTEFKKIIQEEKDFRTLLNNTNKKIKAGEARKNNPLAKKLRVEKETIVKEIESSEKNKYDLRDEFAVLRQKENSLKIKISEQEKNFQIIEQDIKKYDVTINLLDKISLTIKKIKEEKRYSLQKSIAVGLSKLMHKTDFILDVKVIIREDVMDIHLLDKYGEVINKENLSKGEQQLYATVLLNALVEESKIKFPVFIDSPLQKFDKFHAVNIIKEFYPTVSEQVVLLPLLEKELSENEFDLLKGNLNSTYLINNDGNGSQFAKVANSKKLFSTFKENKNVHEYQNQ